MILARIKGADIRSLGFAYISPTSVEHKKFHSQSMASRIPPRELEYGRPYVIHFSYTVTRLSIHKGQEGVQNNESAARGGC